MRVSLAITGVGVVSPVGLSGLVAMHSVRSGMSRLAMQRIPDRVREWIAGGAVPTWVTGVRQRRLLALAIQAMNAALARAECDPNDPGTARHIAVLLGGPERGRPGYGLLSGDIALRQLIADTELASFGRLETVEAGACSAQAGLARAAELFATTSITRCVIGAADTQLQLRTIRWHEDQIRLKCSYATDGLMPAEAAAFVVVEPEDAARARGVPIVARILAVNTAMEAATVLSDLPNAATGMAGAVRGTLEDAGVRPAEVGMVWSDLNGESYRAREWAFTEVRLGFTDSTELMHPADCHGDLGAATDANLLGLAALSHASGWSGGCPALIVSGSEGGWRGATLVAPGDRPRAVPLVMSGTPHVLSEEFRVPDYRAEPDFRASTDPPKAYFEWQLREGHRDELASLHYQRTTLLLDGTVPWPRLQQPEQRMLNHVDAVVASGPVAMAAVADGLQSDEEGEAFAAAFLLGVLPSPANVDRIATSIENAGPARLAGVTAGLRHAPSSDGLRGLIRRLAESANPAAQAVALSVAAFRHLGLSSRLPDVSRTSPVPLALAVAEAAGRLRLVEAAVIERLLLHANVEVRTAALLSLWRTIPHRAAAFARVNIAMDEEFGGAPSLCVGMHGAPQDERLLVGCLESGRVTRSVVRALGVLGTPAAAARLIDLLSGDDEDMKTAAATSLQLMSGLRDRERVLLPIRDDEGSVDSREFERPTTQRDPWMAWRHEHRIDEVPGVRWRQGSAFSWGACLDELEAPSSSSDARMRASLELSSAPAVIPFEPEWFVPLQRDALAAWRSWWIRQGER